MIRSCWRNRQWLRTLGVVPCIRTKWGSVTDCQPINVLPSPKIIQRELQIRYMLAFQKGCGKSTSRYGLCQLRPRPAKVPAAALFHRLHLKHKCYLSDSTVYGTSHKYLATAAAFLMRGQNNSLRVILSDHHKSEIQYNLGPAAPEFL